MGRIDRSFRVPVIVIGAGILLLPSAASAEIYVGGYLQDGFPAPICRASDGELLVIYDGGDCDTGFNADSADGIYFGEIGNLTYIDANGDAEFNGTTDFNGTTNLNGPTNITGPLSIDGSVTAAGLTSTSGMSNTGSFTNTGSATVTGSFTAGSVSSGGSGTFTGALSSSSLTTGSISATSLSSSGSATIEGYFTSNNGANMLGTTQLATAQVYQSLSVMNGATVDMNGNRIQEVGGPVAGTDAANKNYVDAVAGSAQAAADTAQATADTALVNAAAAQTTADTARVEAAAAQATADTSLARTGALGADTAAALGGAAAYDAATGVLSAPSYSIAGESYGNVGAAFEAVDEQLSTLDARLGALGEATDQGFRRANGGIATALALGGTMIVPDSAVSVSFNLATYRGEQGFSGSLVIQAAPKVYISGGIAGSTVKGSTGGRVGVSFGL